MRAKAVRSELYKLLNDMHEKEDITTTGVTNKELDKATNQSILKRLAVAGASAYVARELGLKKVTRGRVDQGTAAGLPVLRLTGQVRKIINSIMKIFEITEALQYASGRRITGDERMKRVRLTDG